MGARTRGNGCSQRVHTRAPPWVPGVPGTTRCVASRCGAGRELHLSGGPAPHPHGHPHPNAPTWSQPGTGAAIHTPTPRPPHRGYRVSPVRRGFCVNGPYYRLTGDTRRRWWGAARARIHHSSQSPGAIPQPLTFHPEPLYCHPAAKPRDLKRPSHNNSPHPQLRPST